MALTERLAFLLDAKSGGMVREFRKASGASTDLGNKTDRAQGLLGRLGERAGLTGAQVKAGIGGAAVAGVGALVAVGVDAVKTFTNLAGEVDDLQDVSGATAEDASRLVNVFKQLGVEPEVAEKALFKLGRTVAEGGAKLAKYGIEVKRNADGTADLVGTLSSVSAAYRSSTDGATRNAIAAEVFGKAGIELADVLSLNEEQLRRLGNTGPIFSQEEVERAKALGVLVRAAGLEFEATKAKAGSFLGEKFIDFTHGLDRLQEKLGIVADGTADARLQQKFLTAETQLGAEAAEKEAAALEEQAKATKSLLGDLVATKNAQRSMASSLEAVGDAEREVVERRDALNALLKEGAVDAKAVDAAERQLASAEGSLADAHERVADARRALNKAERADPLDAEGAALDMADAQDRVADAERELALVRVDSEATANDVADAERNLQRAKLDLRRLELEQQTATSNLTDAREDLTEAEKNLAAAEGDVATAQEQLRIAQEGDASFAERVADARRELAGAEREVADAKWNAAQQALNLAAAERESSDAMLENADSVRQLRVELDELARKYPSIAGEIGLIAPPVVRNPPNAEYGGGDFGRRAAGGPVSAGGAYVVGERGPELLTMGTRGGYVTPSGSWGGGVTNVTINMPPGIDPDAVVRAIKRWEQRNGAVPIATR